VDPPVFISEARHGIPDILAIDCTALTIRWLRMREFVDAHGGFHQ
jgi:hypothetical protein